MDTLGFDENELKIFRRLNTPRKIQDFLEKIPINFEKDKKDTCFSPRRVLRENKAHCIEGALFAAAALRLNGERPFLLDLKATNRDFDHVVALFRRRGLWGAISKTNHAVLRYREPIFRNVRELALSYFHEYFTDKGRKTLRSFSRPFDILRFAKPGWAISEKNLWYIAEALDKSPHFPILSKTAVAELRPADPIEIKAGKLTQWKIRPG
jgi:hypothetical protein